MIRRRWIAAAAVVALVLAGLVASHAAEPPRGLSGQQLGALAPWPRSTPRPVAVLTDPIDPRQQTSVAFGQRSHWAQPWRAYLDTVPAGQLRNALGVNFNVAPDQANSTARLLASAGIRRARVELSWSDFRYGHPNRLTDPGGVATIFRALARYHIRPLVLLNANQRKPCPTRFFTARLAAPAAAGATTVTLTPGTAARVVPGRTGLNAPDGSQAAAVLFTSVTAGDVATLSKPLPQSLSAGGHPAATLLYAPFQAPYESGGTPNPAFASTLAGWLSYVDSAVNVAKRFTGSTQFDVEVWNELTFGSDFLDASTYYDPAPSGSGSVINQVLAHTVALLREPARHLGAVGISDGFSSERPFDSGAIVPRGVTAISKHPYADPLRFPQDAVINGVMPLDALGHCDGVLDGSNTYRDGFIPSYIADFPEYFLTYIQTESLIRDLSPFTTDVYGTPHGRYAHPRGGAPPQLWITEYNLDPGALRNPSATAPLSQQERRIQSKAVLRALLAYINKGVSAFYIYAAQDNRLGIVPNSFLNAAGRSRRYPGDRAGGPTIDAIRTLSRAFRGPTTFSDHRNLRLLAIGDYADRTQFQGQGTRAYTSLYNRDVVAFLPFQVDARRFEIGTYVMTRNVTTTLPPERFAFAIGGLGSCGVSVSVTDPLTGHSVPVHQVSCTRRRLVLSTELTDSPRLLTLTLH